MRRALLTRTSVAVLAGLPWAGCWPLEPETGSGCEAKTQADLQAIAAGELRCDWVNVVETSLEDLSGLRGLDHVVGGVLVVQNERLRSLTGLEDLRGTGQISVAENPALEDVEIQWSGSFEEFGFSLNNNLHALTLELDVTDTRLRVSDSPVTELVISNPGPLRELTLSSLPELSSLDGLEGVISAQVVKLVTLPALPAAAVEGFLSRLDPAPELVEICGVEGYPAC